jgi:hypothetical protein
MKKYFLLTLFIFTALLNICPENIFKDSDQEITFEINKNKKDNSDDKNKSIKKTGDEDPSIVNKWYSRNNIFMLSNSVIGYSGTKDFFEEDFLFAFRFKSRIKHAFSLRLYHNGYAPGLFSKNLTFFNFGAMAGFEYLFKIFSSTEGFFIWSDFGASNGGYAFNAGAGLGDRMRNGLELSATYLHNTAVFGRMEFYFLFIDIFTIRGKIGIDYKYHEMTPEVFTFLAGLNFGFLVKNVFRIELGGGITLNEYGFLRGYGTAAIALNLL